MNVFEKLRFFKINLVSARTDLALSRRQRRYMRCGASVIDATKERASPMLVTETGAMILTSPGLYPESQSHTGIEPVPLTDCEITQTHTTKTLRFFIFFNLKN
jgi:hypothetical protein